MRDYYAILGVSETASAAEIKRAYRSLAVKYHPDKNNKPEAAALFVEINEAYDTLSDPEKKFVYDQRRYGPYRQTVQDEPEQQHRDPKYKPKSRTARRKREKSASYLLMEKWHELAQWANIAGFVLVALLALDYVLPYNIDEETISEIKVVRGRRGGFAYVRIYTEGGKNIKAYEHIGQVGEKFRLYHTLVYRIPMQVESLDESFKIKMGYMYQALMIFPGMLLLISALGIVSRKSVAQSFNYAIGSVILIIITLVLIY